MLTTLLLMALTQAPAADPPKKEEPAAKKELFAQEKWYQNQKGKEETFTGVLEKVDRGGAIGFGRFNPYRLVMTTDGKKTMREVYVGGKPDLLAPYVGKQVKITGKAVDMEVEGREHHEIWPARLEVAGDEKKDQKQSEDGKEPKVLGRAPWQARVNGAQQQLVCRSAKELAAAMGVREKGEDTATKAMAQRFKVDDIDWTKQMVLVVTGGTKPTGGYSVEVTGLDVKDNTLTVRWKLNTPKPGQPVTQALTHPAQAVLVEKFEGTVKFDPPARGGSDKE